jgi:nucleoside-diphosphate kinase
LNLISTQKKLNKIQNKILGFFFNYPFLNSNYYYFVNLLEYIYRQNIEIKTFKMITNRTFTMLKPDSVEKGNIGAILEKISSSGFKIIAMKLTQLSKEDAHKFYAVHKDLPFFESLIEFMTRGPIVSAILEKDNAVEDFRQLIGATNPNDAVEGTIRKSFATSVGENAIHGSDSDENAAIESAFHFSEREMYA